MNRLCVGAFACGIAMLIMSVEVVPQVLVQKPVGATPTANEVIASSITFTPNVVRLEPAYMPVVVQVSVPVALSNIVVQVAKGGQPAPNFTTKVASSWTSGGSISLKAEFDAIVSTGYQLKFSALGPNQQKVDIVIPSTKLSIEVITPALHITRITPSSGERGDLVVLEGCGFLAHTPLHVRFSSLSDPSHDSQLMFWDNAKVGVKVSTVAETGPITVISANGRDRVTSGSAFTVPRKPVIVSFTPEYGLPGTRVNLYGYNLVVGSDPVVKFSNSNTNTFNGNHIVPETTPSSDKGLLQGVGVIAPPGLVTGPITVITPNGTAVSSQSFQSTAANSPVKPTITQFSPVGGPVGTVVTITGSGFGIVPIAVKVTFGSQPQPVSPSSCSNGTLQVSVPSTGATGVIKVTTEYGSATANSIFYMPPVISSITPNQGPVGYQVSINGSNFSSDKYVHVVKFNGIQGSVVSVSGTVMVAEVPTGAASGPITVETPGGKGTSPSSFTVVK